MVGINRVELLADGIGICQMPGAERRAWGGVLKQRMLIADGAGGTWEPLWCRIRLF